jgi:hypothetical protein
LSLGKNENGGNHPAIFISQTRSTWKRKCFSWMMLKLSLTPGFSQVIAAQAEVRNRFRVSCVSRFTWLKPGVNERSTTTFPTEYAVAPQTCFHQIRESIATGYYRFSDF